MPDVTELLRHGASPSQRPTVAGFVSPNRPAPATLDAPLYIIVPSYSLDYSYGPCEWGALHGRTLPAQGTAVLVIFDDQGVPVVVWWAGAADFHAVVKIATTTGLSSAQIDALFDAAPADGTQIADPVNHWLLVRLAGSWYRTAALTAIP